ncbi:restriction endonuclease [Microbacterium sp. NPDC077057]|uniref:restriction endonuclease n=1 Tax=Microbacterium sp. NPDC077057 TaxID=3154763 RepID=UPI003437EA92
MSRIDELTEHYFSNLRQRAAKLVADHEAGLVPDYDRALQEERRIETEQFDAAMKAELSKRIWLGVLTLVGGVGLAIVIGAATLQFWLALLVFGLSCYTALKVLGSSPDIEAIMAQGNQQYIEQLQTGIAEWRDRLEQARRAEERAAATAAWHAEQARLAEEAATMRAIREAEAELEALLAPARLSLEGWQTLHRPPAPQPYGVSPAGAEIWIRDWMIHMGAEGASATQYVGDGGIDVESAHFIAQVKHYTGSVGVGEIREHIGVAAVDERKRRPLFFTSGTYSAGGIDAADRAQMPLFTYSVESGRVLPVNAHAEMLLAVGLNPAWVASEL